jgi:hypothetical protein
MTASRARTGCQLPPLPQDDPQLLPQELPPLQPLDEQTDAEDEHDGPE